MSGLLDFQLTGWSLPYPELRLLEVKTVEKSSFRNTKHLWFLENVAYARIKHNATPFAITKHLR